MKNLKILLVLPAAKHLRVEDPGATPPRRPMLRFSILPLTVVAALTPPRHRVTVCDENVEAIDWDSDADVVGVTFMTALAPRAYEVAAAFRARGKIVVAGGYHPTFCPEEAAEHFDAVVVGEAEGQWEGVLEDIEAGAFKRVYRAAQPADLAGTPAPRRELIGRNARHYVTVNAVQTSRGCPHGCRYCSITAFHRGSQRTRPLANVLDEIRRIPARYFMFVDDNIIGDRAYARRLFAAMAPLGKRWASQCALDIADDPELLRLAHAAGCRGLFIGVETLDAENLAAMGKGFNDSGRYRARLGAIRRQGIGAELGVMVGMDHDGVSVFERTLRFLRTVDAAAIQLNILTTLPGTPLFADLDRQGRVTDRDWSHYDFRHVVIRPAGMTAAELQDGADWLYRQFYRLDRILLRSARALFTLGPFTAYMIWRLNMTYRYDNLRERIVGRNPARARRGGPVRALFPRRPAAVS
jgi:radical SAM superfamily enzyme YgiQ (UPF0313 family)